MKKTKRAIAYLAFTICFTLSLACAFLISAPTIRAADETEVTYYRANFDEMSQMVNTDNVYTSLICYNAAEYLSDQTTSINLHGDALSRLMSKDGGVKKRYSAALVWTAPANGTLVTSNAKLNLVPYANTRITIYKGTIEDGLASNLVVLHDESFETRPSAEVLFYDSVTGTINQGESIIVTARTVDETVSTTPGWINYTVQFAFDDESKQRSSYTWNMPKKNEGIYYDSKTGKFDVSAWKEGNPTYSYYAISDIEEVKSTISFNDRQGGALSSLTQNVKDGNKITLPHYKNLNVIRHRGADADAPENTEPAFRLAKEQGSSTVETDVCFTKDGVPVLLHDSTVNRTSDGTGNVADLTLAELKALDFGSWKDEKYAGTKILTLAEFFDLIKEIDLKAYVEIKISYTFTDEYAKTVTDLVTQKGVADRLSFISFSAGNLSKISANLPTVRLGGLSNALSQDDVNKYAALENGTNEVFISAKYTGVDAEGIARVKAEGLALEVWTVPNDSSVNALDDYITGVTTSFYYPDKAVNSVFIGWYGSDGTLYKAGGEYTVNGDMSFTAAFIEFSMDKGAFFKIGEDETESGVAFRSRMKVGDYEKFVKSYGTIILPTSTLNGKEFTLDNFVEGTSVVKVVSTKSVTENGETVWLGGLGTIKTANFTRDFSGRGYIEIKYSDNSVGYVYTDYSDELNSNNVADMAAQYKKTWKADYEALSESRRAIVDAYIVAKTED